VLLKDSWENKLPALAQPSEASQGEFIGIQLYTAASQQTLLPFRGKSRARAHCRLSGRLRRLRLFFLAQLLPGLIFELFIPAFRKASALP
jgi:hypothetical protein